MFLSLRILVLLDDYKKSNLSRNKVIIFGWKKVQLKYTYTHQRQKA